VAVPVIGSRGLAVSSRVVAREPGLGEVSGPRIVVTVDVVGGTRVRVLQPKLSGAITRVAVAVRGRPGWVRRRHRFRCGQTLRQVRSGGPAGVAPPRPGVSKGVVGVGSGRFCRTGQLLAWGAGLRIHASGSRARHAVIQPVVVRIDAEPIGVAGGRAPGPSRQPELKLAEPGGRWL
jgi:hypothetical protein